MNTMCVKKKRVLQNSEIGISGTGLTSSHVTNKECAERRTIGLKFLHIYFFNMPHISFEGLKIVPRNLSQSSNFRSLKMKKASYVFKDYVHSAIAILLKPEMT